jgi:hypothetical protein
VAADDRDREEMRTIREQMAATERRQKPAPTTQSGQGTEREGFEPSVDFEAHTRFPVVPVQPLRHLSTVAQASGQRAARDQICQIPPRSRGTRSQAAVRPVTSTAGEPIMKSM